MGAPSTGGRGKKVVKACGGPQGLQPSDLPDVPELPEASECSPALVQAFAESARRHLESVRTGSASALEFAVALQSMQPKVSPSESQPVLDVLDELVRVHWASDNDEPQHAACLAVLAALGYCRGVSSYGTLDAPQALKGRPPAPSPAVCAWVQRHCPPPAEQPSRDREMRQLERLSHFGLLHVAETLYVVHRSFEWLGLLPHLPRHMWRHAHALDLSDFDEEGAGQLQQAFRAALQREAERLRAAHEEAAAAEAAAAAAAGGGAALPNFEVEAVEEKVPTLSLELQALLQFCPSVECLSALTATATASACANLWAAVEPRLGERLQCIHFTKADEEAWEVLTQAVPGQDVDKLAIALFNRRHHPSEERYLASRDVVRLVGVATARLEGDAPAAELLTTEMLHWLKRRMPFPGLTKEQANVLSIKQICAAIADTVEAHTVLGLPCFERHGDELSARVYYQLSVANFIRDAKPATLLGCWLHMEATVEATKVERLQHAVDQLAGRCARAACGESESGHLPDDLLQLLFNEPTPLRCSVIEDLVTLTGTGLQGLLINAPLWLRLLSGPWQRSHLVRSHPLGDKLGAGLARLSARAAQVREGSVALAELRLALGWRAEFEALVQEATGQSIGAILDVRQAALQKFDEEFRHLRVYVGVFCAGVGLEAAQLEELVASVGAGEGAMELRAAERAFQDVLVRDAMPWLHSVHQSDVFRGMWRAAVAAAPFRSQSHIVAEVIPQAQLAWGALAGHVEQGTAVLRDIRWCAEHEWAKVQAEVVLLEQTGPAFRERRWAEAALKDVWTMRLAVKLRDLAPSLLHLRQRAWEAIFAPTDTTADSVVQALTDAVGAAENLWEQQLRDMPGHVSPHRQMMESLPPLMQDYVILLAQHDGLLAWLLDSRCTDSFNSLIALCRPNTDDPALLAALAALQQTRTFLARVLYEASPHADLGAFLRELAALDIDEVVYAALGVAQRGFAPAMELLSPHARTPGAHALHHLREILATGAFLVRCSAADSELLSCRTGSRLLAWEEVVEVRRQLLLMDGAADLQEAPDVSGLLAEFSEKLGLAEHIGRCVRTLHLMGHFAYAEGEEALSLSAAQTADSFREQLATLEVTVADWQRALEVARDQHYFLNYFTIREIGCAVRALRAVGCDDARGWAAAWPLLRVVDPGAEEQEVLGKVRRSAHFEALSLPRGSEGDVLVAFGLLLGELFGGCAPRERPVGGLHTQGRGQLQGDLLAVQAHHPEDGPPIFACCAEEPSQTLHLVLSVYARRGRIPEAEELLLCTPHTTSEQVELLLRRFFSAKQHGREHRLYCLGNLHLLPYAVQCAAAGAVHRLERKFEYGAASALLLVSGLPNQALAGALGKAALAAAALPAAQLADLLVTVGERYHGRQMEVVCGDMCGVGKTHHIYRKIAQVQDDAQGRPVLFRVEVRENTTTSRLVSTLCSDPTDPDIQTAVYLDLAHVVPANVDAWLFELLVVGMLRDQERGAVYHRRELDSFIMELPNTPLEAPAKDLPFCNLLPRTFLRMGEGDVDPDEPMVTSVPCGPRDDGHALLVGFRRNDRLALVGKVLIAMRREAFNPRSQDFDVRWTAQLAAPISPQLTYELVHEVCAAPDAPMSYLIFTSFVNFFGALVALGESWNMMNLNLLQNFDPGLKHFKHCLYRILVETAKHFALRQVPKRAPGAEERAGLGAGDVHSNIERFAQMISWESCEHPIAVFKKNEYGSVIGISMMCLRQEFLGQFVDRNLQNSLNLNDLKLYRDWSRVTHQEAVALVKQTEGGDALLLGPHWAADADGAPAPQHDDYVVTVDNLLKLMGIHQRLKYGLPVVLMGETGCGKTALVKFMAHALHIQLFVLNVHGGITDEAITDFLDAAIAQADHRRGAIVFFDEINAANCMALFKSIILDRAYGNKRVPPHVRIISCCNPYRLRRRRELEDVALVFRHSTGESASGITDPMKDLVYRVHPLPESLIDVVTDFGALTSRSEALYVSAILRKELPRAEGFGAEGAPSVPGLSAGLAEFHALVPAFSALVCRSHDFLRQVSGGETSVVSMRDVVRAARVFKWFLHQCCKLHGYDPGDAAACQTVRARSRPRSGRRSTRRTGSVLTDELRSALVLTMAYCYHSRLDRAERAAYRAQLCAELQAQPAAWLRFGSVRELEALLEQTQLQFVGQMELGRGIALNEALRENLFMLLVSIMNQIPIMLVGKPGCSKSLAMEILKNNLRGHVSTKDFFRAMPAVDVLAYQCSPLSTPEAILGVFRSARQSNIANKRTIVCVLLDEVGLAEESPHLPLKVLHQELEDLQGIACVGISNWALDAAKMNRCVTLYRAPPTARDLCQTAEGMVACDGVAPPGYLSHLSEAFFEVYRSQRQPEFWGMREFYSTVKVITSRTTRCQPAGDSALDGDLVMKAVQRNFGGRPVQEVEECVEVFFRRLGMESGSVPRVKVVELIRQNLQEPDARHLMLLTKNNAALRLLFDCGILGRAGEVQAEVMFGSPYAGDQGDACVAANLQRVKTLMRRPIRLVMVHCDALYESLYDLLNQHYMEYGGERYVRVAHGSKAKLCPMHPLFRVIVLAEAEDAYSRLPPPLLNRFEKHVLSPRDLLGDADAPLLRGLEAFSDAIRARADQLGPRVRPPLAGYHPDLLASLALLSRPAADQSLAAAETLAKRRLTQVLTPEVACAFSAGLREAELQEAFGFDLVSEYFDKQSHSDMAAFAKSLALDRGVWCDAYGSQVMVLTSHSGVAVHEIERATGGTAQEVSLHQLCSSHEVESLVANFYHAASATGSQAAGGRWLVIHADSRFAESRTIRHACHVCEQARRSFVEGSAERLSGGNAYVLLVVHLHQSVEPGFTFDFTQQWHCVFLDAVGPCELLPSMPPLVELKGMRLVDLVSRLDLLELLRRCFRPSLSRLVYPYTRSSEDLRRQIDTFLDCLRSDFFVETVRDWVFKALDMATADDAGLPRGAVSAHALALAGTVRGAVYHHAESVVGSLLTQLLAHLDRNGGLALFLDGSKVKVWAHYAEAFSRTPMLQRLAEEAVASARAPAAARREVKSDALTCARPFVSRFPFSWWVSRTIDGLRRLVEGLPRTQQQEVLDRHFRNEASPPVRLVGSLLDDYLFDFCAMHVQWSEHLDRRTQSLVLKRILQGMKGGELESASEVHLLFWGAERELGQCIRLLGAARGAVVEVERLLDRPAAADLGTLGLDLLILADRSMAEELLQEQGHKASSLEAYRDWLRRTALLGGLAWELVHEGAGAALDGHTSARGSRLVEIARLRRQAETLALLLEHVAIPLALPSKEVARAAWVVTGRGARCTDEEQCERCRAAEQQPCGTAALEPMLAAAATACWGDGERGEAAPRAWAAFVEAWLLEVALRDAPAMSALSPACLRLCCSLAAGLPVAADARLGVAPADAGEAEAAAAGAAPAALALLGAGMALPRSGGFEMAVLRKLVVEAGGETRESAKRTIEELLQQARGRERHADTAFAARYALLCEEQVSAALSPRPEPALWPVESLEGLLFDRGEQITHVLEAVGRVRWMLATYADIICQEPLDASRHAEALAKVNALLVTDSEVSQGISRSLRLYVLKCIERARGLSFVRAVLASEPVCEAKWVVAWRQAGDASLEQFMSAQSGLRWSPFARAAEDAGTLGDASRAIQGMQVTGTTDALERCAQACGPGGGGAGQLCAAICHNARLLGNNALLGPRLHDWLSTSPSLLATDKERRLLRVFAQEPAVCADPSRPLLGRVFQPGTDATDEHVRWRVLGHLCAALLGAPPASLLYHLRTLMLDPQALADGESYLPGMDGTHALVMAAMGVSRTARHHMYRCTCGYTFFIGECSQPMQAVPCPQCGVQIGGKQHVATKDTHHVVPEETDRPLSGYTLPEPKVAQAEMGHVFVRELSGFQTRVVRLLVHGSMLLGLAAHPGPGVYSSLGNRESSCTLGEGNEVEYIGGHFVRDWRLLAQLLMCGTEDVAAVLHHLIERMSAATMDWPQAGPQPYQPRQQQQQQQAQMKPQTQGDVSWTKLTCELRDTWERTLQKKYLAESADELRSRLPQLYARWQPARGGGGAAADGEDGLALAAELREAADVRDLPDSRRRRELPRLWTYRAPATMEGLRARLGAVQEPERAFPVLSAVLQGSLLEALPALSSLPGLLQWHALVARSLGRVAREEAAKTTVGQFLCKLPEADKDAGERAYSHLERAWRLALSHVQRHGCTEVPRSPPLRRESSMLCCIADPQGEGLWPLALTHWLVQRHNELAQAAHAAMARAGQGDAAPAIVSSSLLGEHDVIRYEEGDLMRLVHGRCVTHGSGGRLSFDLARLEEHLQHRMARPEIALDLRSFEWQGEACVHVVKQRDLGPDVLRRLTEEVRDESTASRCLEKVRMASAFIQNSGGVGRAGAGDMLLSAYLVEVLAEAPTSLPSATAREQVTLSRLAAFESFLRRVINPDPMGFVDQRYRTELPQELLAALRAAMPELPVPALVAQFEHDAEKFHETYLSHEVSVVDFLQATALSEDEGQWAAVLRSFPAGLRLEHWAATYRALRGGV